MNWNSPCAEEVEAPAPGLKSDSIFAVASRYWKLVPLDIAACLIAPATRRRAGSTPALDAFDVSTDIVWSPLPAKRPAFRPKRRLPPAFRQNSQCRDYG